MARADRERLTHEVAQIVYGRPDCGVQPRGHPYHAEHWRKADAIVALVLDRLTAEAAGELLIPAPEPGTDLARVRLANRMLKRENERLADELEREHA